MKTLLSLAALGLFLSPISANALPDCTTVSPDSRLAGCHGLPDFAVERIVKGDHETRDRQASGTFRGWPDFSREPREPQEPNGKD